MATIVIIEDDELNRAFFETVLQTFGYSVCVTKDAHEGLLLIRRMQPDAVIMDTSLPGLNGLDAVQMLKDDPNLRHIPVLGLTVYTEPEVRTQMLASGFDSTLVKPFDTSALRRALGMLLQ